MGRSRKKDRSTARRRAKKAKQEQILSLQKQQGSARVERLSAPKRRLRERGAKEQGKDESSHLSAREQELLELGSKSPKYQP
jgi:hypothetical protein